MERWSGILKVPLRSNCQMFHKVGVSLCLSSTSESLIVPSANAIFFNGDRVHNSGNAVIERLSNIQNIAEILVSKFGGSINAWVIEASSFNGPFALYNDFIPSLNKWGEPNSYNPSGFPASKSIVSLLNNCFEEIKLVLSKERKKGQDQTSASGFHSSEPTTYILGFSKGGVVLNQILTELALSDFRSLNKAPQIDQYRRCEIPNIEEEVQIIPTTEQALLSSISQVHYVDVGLNSSGAYLTDEEVIKKISNSLATRSFRIQFVLHGTPRQWRDSRRIWIREEKEKLESVLRSEAQINGGIEVTERFYFADRIPDLQMHFLNDLPHMKSAISFFSFFFAFLYCHRDSIEFQIVARESPWVPQPFRIL